MSDLLNPQTGRPFPKQKQARAISDEDLMKILQVHDHKLTACNIQLTQQGLFVEFLVEHIANAVDADDNPLIPMDMDSFPKWAEARIAEIRAKAAEMNVEQSQEQAAKAQEYLEEQMAAREVVDIKLDE